MAPRGADHVKHDAHALAAAGCAQPAAHLLHVDAARLGMAHEEDTPNQGFVKSLGEDIDVT